MGQRKPRPPRLPLRGAALRAAVAAKEAARAELAAYAAAREDVSRAAAIIASVQAQALSPAGGWWRRRQRRLEKMTTLRRAAVWDAVSVGCSTAQIARAAGATAKQVENALKGKPSDDQWRDWDLLLADAERRGLSFADLAREQGVGRSWVWVAAKQRGYRETRDGTDLGPIRSAKHANASRLPNWPGTSPLDGGVPDAFVKDDLPARRP